MPVVLTLAFVAPLASGAGFDSDWPRIVAAMETSRTRGSEAGLREARKALNALLGPSLPRDSAKLVRYASAYAAWRLAVLPQVRADDREALLESALGELQQAVALDERFAEAHALMGSVYGLQIASSPMKGMTLGPEAQAVVERALRIEPRNPRIVMGKGIGAFHTPEEWGGGIAQAEPLLRQAMALFQQEPADRPWPSWGRAEAHAWLGQILLARGDKAGARAEYQKALALEPESGWVRFVLLPALDNGAKR